MKEFWERAREAEQPLRTWIRVVRHADWKDPHAVQKTFPAADVLKRGRVVFNIGGNKYRLVAWINYPYRVLYVRFVGTHRSYDKIDANEV